MPILAVFDTLLASLCDSRDLCCVLIVEMQGWVRFIAQLTRIVITNALVY